MSHSLPRKRRHVLEYISSLHLVILFYCLSLAADNSSSRKYTGYPAIKWDGLQFSTLAIVMDISTNVSRFSVFMNHHPTDTADGPSDLPAYSVDATSDSDSEPGSQSTNPIPGQTLGIPAYSSNILRRERSEHTFVLNNRRNEPWATLKLKSSARSPDNMPTFVDDEPIEGSLLFSLDKKESITSVSVTVGCVAPFQIFLLTTVSR